MIFIFNLFERCENCRKIVTNHTDDLDEAMKSYEYDKLTAEMNKIIENNIEIDVKLYLQAVTLQ